MHTETRITSTKHVWGPNAHSILSQYSHEYMNYSTSSVNTRRPVDTKKYLDVAIFNPQIHKSKAHFDRSVAYDGPILWNRLSLAI